MDQLTCRWSNATPVIHMVMPSSPPMWMSWVSNHLGYVKPALSRFATQKSLRLSSNCPFREESTSNQWIPPPPPPPPPTPHPPKKTKKNNNNTVMWKMCPCHGVIMKMVHDILASIFGHFYWHPMIIFKLLLSFDDWVQVDDIFNIWGTFYPRSISAFRYCLCLRLSVRLCLCINRLHVCAITRHLFKLESPNLDRNAKHIKGQSTITFNVKFTSKVKKNIPNPFKCQIVWFTTTGNI